MRLPPAWKKGCTACLFSFCVPWFDLPKVAAVPLAAATIAVGAAVAEVLPS